MLLTKEVDITINGKLISHYKNIGYTSFNKKIKMNISDLLPNSKIKVDVQCDNCNNQHNIHYYNYINNINKNNGNYFCNDCKKERIKKTNIERYGVISTLSNIDTINKIKETNIKRYGVEHPLQNDSILKKLKKTNIEKYGHSVSLLNENVRNKRKKTMVLKYGTEHALKSNICMDKLKKTNNERYGCSSYPKTDNFKDKLNIKTIKRYKNKKINLISINNQDYTIKCDKCDNEYTINRDLLKTRLLRNIEPCVNCFPINTNVSDKENKLLEFIQDNYNGEIIQNNRTLIDLELDVYLPNLNLAFEFNGVYWHNELFKENNYHQKKSKLCLDKNTQLIHIWEDDWIYKNDIIKSMILNKLSKTKNKLYGRKCTIKEISDNKLVKDFLNINHLQGFVSSSIKLGLFYEDELVSLMTFGKLRKPLNTKSIENEFEMLRFCNKLNTSVVGGASKLFKYFTKNYNFNNITSYANLDHSNGNIYKQLGFSFINITTPGYYYIVNGIKQHRFKFRKNILVEEGYDLTKTEHQIMLERKIYRIYNSGNYKFIYKNI